jgi:hypothetical protein
LRRTGRRLNDPFIKQGHEQTHGPVFIFPLRSGYNLRMVSLSALLLESFSHTLDAGEYPRLVGGVVSWQALLSLLGGVIRAVAVRWPGRSSVGTVAGWRKSDKTHPRWALVSAVGGGLATLPAYLAGIALIAGPQVGYFVIGGVYGAIFGGLQALMLRRTFEEGSAWWVTANLLAGGLCGCLTMTASLPGLPLVCSPGPAVFGLLTGWAMLAMRRGA